MTGRSQHLSAVTVAILGIVLLMFPAHAHASAISSIVVNDTLPNDQVSLVWTGGFPNAFTGFSLSSNCTATAGATANGGSATCSETSPIVLTLDGVGNLTGATSTINVNVWEDHFNGTLSDTLSIVGTQLTTNTVEGTLTFRSDVEGVPPLTPLAGGTGISLFNFVENGQPLNGTLGGADSLNPISITATSDVEVPEPNSMLLVGSGIVVIAGACRLRSRRRS